MNKILCAMSGGVDSTAAALLLRDSGYDVTGVTLLLSDNERDAEEAGKVCASLGFEHITLDLKNEFRELVEKDFCEVYLSGGTPNPCVVCNKRIKFGLLHGYAKENGFDGVATGHYVRKTEVDGHVLLRRASDEKKDQSYMLWQLSEEEIDRSVFPLAELTKSEIREMLEKRGIPNHDRPDSQDICFVPDGDYVGFIKSFAGYSPVPGNFIDASGKIIGRHLGNVRYTVGQRKGLGVAFGEPAYVLSRNADDNTVTLGKDRDLYRSVITVGNSYINPVFSDTRKFDVKIRYAHKASPACVKTLGDGRLEITFDEPQRAAAKGQSAVLYLGDILAGGGFIE